MAEKIHVFSIALGPAGASFSKESLETRKAAAREEIAALIPDTKSLIHSVLSEYVYAMENQLVLAFDLVESPQQSFSFITDNESPNISVLNQLFIDAKKLRESAEFSQIRIGEMTSLMARYSSGLEDSTEGLSQLAPDELAIWNLMNKYRGKHLRLRFPEDDLTYHFPDFPLYIPERGTRVIRARVENISSSKAELSSVNEIKSGGSNNNSSIPRKIFLHKPSFPIPNTIWPLLYAALDNRALIEAEVRVALRADNHGAAYLELICLRNNHTLWPILKSWAGTAKL